MYEVKRAVADKWVDNFTTMNKTQVALLKNM